MTQNFIDNEPSDVVNVLDRGLAYGDGCFTTALVKHGQMQMFEQHIHRLSSQSQQLLLPTFDLNLLKSRLIKVCESIELGVVKIMITSGSGGRGYSRQGVSNSRVIITTHTYPSFYSEWQRSGIHIGISEQKLGINPLLAGLKHLNRLEQVLIRAELDNRSEDDLLVTDINGDIIECCSANVFWFKAGQWYTPCLSSAGVKGLMRDKVIESDLGVIQGSYQLSDLDGISAMFITNAILGIVPVNIFAQKPLMMSPVNEIQKQLIKE